MHFGSRGGGTGAHGEGGRTGFANKPPPATLSHKYQLEVVFCETLPLGPGPVGRRAQSRLLKPRATPEVTLVASAHVALIHASTCLHLPSRGVVQTYLRGGRQLELSGGAPGLATGDRLKNKAWETQASHLGSLSSGSEAGHLYEGHVDGGFETSVSQGG